MKRLIIRTVLLACGAVLTLASAASANAGLPMIAVYWSLAWLAFLPILLIETWIGVRMLKSPGARTFGAVTAGNLLSTLLGIPLTWLALVAIEMKWFGDRAGVDSLAGKVYAVTAQAPWLIPYEGHLRWMIPAAVVVLSIPFCLISIVSEFLVARLILRDQPGWRLFAWQVRANAVSYLLLIVVTLILASFH
jgi:hypothetical protein